MESNQVLKGVIESLPAKTGSGYAGGQYGDLIQLYADDGTPNGKISRDALMSCVKDSLGTLLNQGAADLGTSLAKIPALNSGGTLGSATVANLASVLGVGNKIDSSTNLDNLKTLGLYWWDEHYPSNSGGTDQWCYIVVKDFNTNKRFVIQEIYKLNSRDLLRTRVCDNGTWVEWKGGMPSFYKNYATLAELSSGLNVWKFVRSLTSTDDMKDLSVSGFYEVATYDMPSSAPINVSGVLVVLALSSSRRFLLFITTSNEMYATRMWDGNWNTWAQI